jgi:hypothetical protein
MLSFLQHAQTHVSPQDRRHPLLLLWLHQQPLVLPKFAPLRTHTNFILTKPLNGRMTCYFEATKLDDELPLDGVNGWVALCHEDKSSGEEGSPITCPSWVVTSNGENEPAKAHGGGGPALGGPRPALGGAPKGWRHRCRHCFLPCQL